MPVAVLPLGASGDMLRVRIGDECHDVDRTGIIQTLRPGPNHRALDDKVKQCGRTFRAEFDGDDPDEGMEFGPF